MAQTKRIAVDALLAAIALLLFMVEAQIPAVIPIPGIKPGLANIMTLIALRLFGRRDAAAVLFVRVALGAVLAGNLSTFCFSASGALLCFLLLCVLQRIRSMPLWVCSVFGAVAHNVGQLLIAVFWMHSVTVFWYAPYLLLSAIITGSFTGLCAQFVLQKLTRKEDILS